jgi:hypothetical protein
VSGTVTNNFTAPIDNVVVSFTITYGSTTTSYSSPVSGTIPAGGTGSWEMTIQSGSAPNSIAASHIGFSYAGAYSSCPT